MQMTEKYVLSVKVEGTSVYAELGTYDTEEAAVQRMWIESYGLTGAWKIDRVMTVTVQTISKARA